MVKLNCSMGGGIQSATVNAPVELTFAGMNISEWIAPNGLPLRRDKREVKPWGGPRRLLRDFEARADTAPCCGSVFATRPAQAGSSALGAR